MKSPRVTTAEFHQNYWWQNDPSPRQANTATGSYDEVSLMVTTQQWSCEVEQPGVRTDKSRLRFRLHL